MALGKGSKSLCEELLVVAIDVGTTYSGYAFSFRSQFDKDPTKISANTVWTSGSKDLISLKTPTLLLLHWANNIQEFTVHGFGYDAENKYDQLVMHDEHEDYYLVRHFKMELYNKTASSGLTRDSTLSIGPGKTIRLTTLYGMAIRLLKEHCMDTLGKRNTEVESDDILWVLTVPAIWTDAGKQIMMEAAVEAGIKSEKLTIVLEPEAASLFCLHMPSLTSQEFMLTEGSKYIVIDAGGGTVDINVHEVKEGHTLTEIQAACGGPWGGTMVDYAFTRMITEIVGKDVFDKFSEEYRDDMLELCRDFEAKKRNFDSNKRREIFKLPSSLAETYQTVNQELISEAFIRSMYKDTVTKKRDKIMLDAPVMQSFFNDSCNNIVMMTEEILAGKSDEGIDTIVLVGGYGESHILQDVIKSHFQNLKIIIPEEAGLAVLKGAVIYGHNPGLVLSRVAKRTYGVECNPFFVEGLHPESKKYMSNGNYRCTDVFRTHIRKGQNMKWSEQHPSVTYSPSSPTQSELQFSVYGSTDTDPKFVTDKSCTYLGQLTVSIPDTSSGLSRDVDVSFQFDTHIKVTAVTEATKEKTTACIDFLSI